MNLKNNKGFVGVDISIAILLLVIIVPTITGMIFNINKSRNGTKRQAQATNIITNAMEISKIVEYTSDDDTFLDEIFKRIEIQYSGNIIESSVEPVNNSSVANKENWTENGATYSLTTGILNLRIDEIVYQLKISIQDNSEVENGAVEGEKKIVRSKVTYKLGSEEKTISLKTYFIFR